MSLSHSVCFFRFQVFTFISSTRYPYHIILFKAVPVLFVDCVVICIVTVVVIVTLAVIVAFVALLFLSTVREEDFLVCLSCCSCTVQRKRPVRLYFLVSCGWLRRITQLYYVKLFIRRLVYSMQSSIGQVGCQLVVAQYSTNIQTVFNSDISTNWTMEEALDAVENLTLTEENSGNVTAALDLVDAEVDKTNTSEIEDRSNASSIVVLMNGEQDLVEENSVEIAEKLKDTGSTVYTIGQGNLRTSSPTVTLASKPIDSHVVVCRTSEQLSISTGLVKTKLDQLQGIYFLLENKLVLWNLISDFQFICTCYVIKLEEEWLVREKLWDRVNGSVILCGPSLIALYSY